MRQLSNALLNSLIFLQMLAIKFCLWKPFIRKTHHPQVTQDALLKQIIESNTNTQFGRAHNFESIADYKDFQNAVPVHHYDDLSPYIKNQDNKKETAIHTERPILFSVTSGTTGTPKYIPLYPSTMVQFKAGQALSTFSQSQGVPGIFSGKVLAIGSPVVEGSLDSGTPFGSVSGLLLKSVPYSVRRKYILPFEVFDIEDYQLKYFLICAFGLKEKEVSFLASANPSTFLKMMEVIQSEWDNLINFIDDGTLPDWLPPNSQYTAFIDQHFKPFPVRSDELKKLSSRGNNLTFDILWPNLRAAATWTGGSCKILIPKLRSLLASQVKIIELGYLSSEFRGSLTVDFRKNKCIPTFQENFYEFVEIEAWEQDNPNFLTLNQIETGKHYYVIATTQNSLYRYFINDIITVTGFFNKTPTIEFVQKGKGTTNITGEKLSEHQLIEALDRLKKQLEVPFDFFVMLADPENLRYSLYIESPPQKLLADKLEDELNLLNIEFDAKRKSGRLNPTQIIFLQEGTGEEYKKFSLANSQREGQFKIVRLQYTRDCLFDFLPFQIGSQ